MPKFNNNDESYILLEWKYSDGDTVPADTVVAEMETSKAVQELELDRPAVLHRLVEAGAEYKVGQTLAWLFESEQERQEHLATGAAPAREQPADEADPVVLSRAAQDLADRHGIGSARLRNLGKQVVRAADIQALIGATPQGSVVELSRRQRAIAAVVTESHQRIPTAFVAVKVWLTAVGQLSRPDGEPVGLVELLVKAIATQHATLPILFSCRIDERSVLAPDTPGVAVTIDVGNGLFLPVVHDAADRRIDEIADQLMEFRIKALRQSFREEDFSCAHITLSLHNEPGVVIARPIVFPGQSAMVVLCGTEQEICQNPGGSLSLHDCTTIGISYDHRLVNGREAMQFLQRIKHLLEDPDACATLLD